ncbi:MAG: hypothetical protein QXW65_03385, partial [Candidatus Pacearchaeota archaeon]
TKNDFDIKGFVSIVYFYIVSIAVLLTIIIIVAIVLNKIRERQHIAKKNLKKKLCSLERELAILKSKYLRGKISSDEYEAKKREFEEEIKKITKEISKRAKTLVEIDKHIGELKGLISAFEKIRYHYARGEIMDEDYEKFLSEHVAKMEKLRSDIVHSMPKEKESKQKNDLKKIKNNKRKLNEP